MLTLLAYGILSVAAQTAHADPTKDLWDAIQAKNLDALEAAVDAGANLAAVSGSDSDQVTPLMLSISTDFVDGALALIEAGSPVNYVSQPVAGANVESNFLTALTLASSKRDLSLANALIHRGANPNHVEKWGMSPLMHAAESGNAGMVALLLEAGANPCRRNVDDEDAATIARKSGFNDVATHLESQPCRDLTEQARQKISQLLGCYIAETSFDHPISNPENKISTLRIVNKLGKPAELVLDAFIGLEAVPGGIMSWNIALDQGAFQTAPNAVGIDHWVAETPRARESVVYDQTRYQRMADGKLEFRDRVASSAYNSILTSQLVLRSVACP